MKALTPPTKTDAFKCILAAVFTGPIGWLGLLLTYAARVTLIKAEDMETHKTGLLASFDKNDVAKCRAFEDACVQAKEDMSKGIDAALDIYCSKNLPGWSLISLANRELIKQNSEDPNIAAFREQREKLTKLDFHDLVGARQELADVRESVNGKLRELGQKEMAAQLPEISSLPDAFQTGHKTASSPLTMTVALATAVLPRV